MLIVGWMCVTSIAAGGGARAAQPATPGATPAAGADTRLFEAVAPEDRQAVAAETAGRLSHYRIDATLDPGAAIPSSNPAGIDAAGGAEERDGLQAAFEGRLDMTFVNDTGQPLAEIFFRLYPNDARYGAGMLRIRDVRIGGDRIAPAFSVGRTVARMPLQAPVPPGGTTEISMTFSGVVAPTFDFFSSLYNTDPTTGTVNLVHWHPILAGFDPETGWVLGAPSYYGDLVFSEVALYDVAITAPAEATLVTTGVQIGDAERVEGGLRRRFVSGPARQFAMTADDDYASVSADVDGTAVISYFTPGNEVAGARVLDQAVAALTLFNDLYGRYPFTELNLVEAPLGTPAGTEVSHLILLDTSLYGDPALLPNLGLTERLVEFIVAQGVANQWWYGLVGVNHYAHPFVDEGLSEFSAALYVGRRYGADEAERILDLADRSLLAYELLVSGDQVVDQPGNEFPTSGSYFAIVYGKGALGFDALHAAIGDETFVAALRDFADSYRFRIATPDDLLETFEDASGEDLTELWSAWFESATTTADIVIETTPATPIASG